MNSNLDRLQRFPFEKLSALLNGVQPNAELELIPLYIGEPKHPTPDFICRTLIENLAGLSTYPTTLGADDLRVAIAGWLQRRHGLRAISASSEIIPVNGSPRSRH